MVHFDKPSTPKAVTPPKHIIKKKPCPKCGNPNVQWEDEHTWICYNCVGDEKPEPKPRKPAKPALSESFWISWGFLQTSIDSVFKKWPSMHAHFDIVKTELEALK